MIHPDEGIRNVRTWLVRAAIGIGLIAIITPQHFGDYLRFAVALFCGFIILEMYEARP